MEIRASYLLVGAVVLGLIGALAAFSVWLVRADVDRNLARYEIAFAGAVSGLRQGGQVLYRGIPVGRVARIRIDPANVEQVLVTVEIERATPIMADTVATLEMQGITGIAYVLLRGGTQGAARLDPDAEPAAADRRAALVAGARVRGHARAARAGARGGRAADPAARGRQSRGGRRHAAQSRDLHRHARRALGRDRRAAGRRRRRGGCRSRPCRPRCSS